MSATADDERLAELERRLQELEKIVVALVDLVAARSDHDDAVARLVRAHRDLLGEQERKQRRR